MKVIIFTDYESNVSVECWNDMPDAEACGNCPDENRCYDSLKNNDVEEID